MPTLATLVQQLVGTAAPVICLDTCDILEVVQCIDWEKPGTPRSVACIEPASRLIKTLAVNPNQVSVVITDLVRHEWSQNINAVETKAKEFLARIDSLLDGPYQAAGFTGTALPSRNSVSSNTLVSDLVNLSAALLKQAAILDLDSSLTDRALARVMSKSRPSHGGHVKDSINFEHYVQLARSLRSAKFKERVIFVSKNRKDYWDGEKPQIHPDLKMEIDDVAVQLGFYGSLTAALPSIGI